MATTNTITDREFFTYSSVYAQLADCAQKHDPETFIRTGHMMDTCPTQTLRGLSYAGWMLSQIEVSERNPQWTLAQQAIAELTSLVATVLEHQNDATIEQMVLDDRAGKHI